MTTFTTRDIPPALRRKSQKTDWKEVRDYVYWAALLGSVILAYSLALMVLTTLILKSWETPHLPYEFPIRKDGSFVALGALCDGARTGDLLTYCK